MSKKKNEERSQNLNLVPSGPSKNIAKLIFYLGDQMTSPPPPLG